MIIMTVLFLGMFGFLCVNAPSTGSEWDGEWQTEYGKMVISIDNDNHAKGTYGTYNGTLEGKYSQTMEGMIFVGTWTQGNKKGWFNFRIRSYNDLSKFNGKWGFEGNKAEQGKWNGERIWKN